MDVDDAIADVQNVGVKETSNHILETRSSQAQADVCRVDGGAMEGGKDTNIRSLIVNEGAAILANNKAPPRNDKVNHL